MTGTAIHIGLNAVDPEAYEGWEGTLFACENDARSMEEITLALGYDTQLLLTSQATVDAVFEAISQASGDAQEGDICVITYAGHGGQFADLDDEEIDRKDETWLLYDREVLDDEIHAALAGFASGVRVVVVSDSCHSGTVVRAIYDEALEQPALREAYERVGTSLRSRARKTRARGLRLRGAPPDVQAKLLRKHRALYEAVRARTPRPRDVDLAASILLLSGCMDNQESAEQNGHGVFTAALLEEWDDGAFSGDYAALHNAILTQLPSTQSPNYARDGVTWPEFEAQLPFTIEPPGVGGDVEEVTEDPKTEQSGSPWVEGPFEPVSQSSSAPYFIAHTGEHAYYIFQITSDPDLFRSRREGDRVEGNWYSSWDDPEAPARFADEMYWLPDYAWETLRRNYQLWFRIGTTPTEDSWDGYAVSTLDNRGADAPSLILQP